MRALEGRLTHHLLISDQGRSPRDSDAQQFRLLVEEALEELTFASMLMRRMDSATVREKL